MKVYLDNSATSWPKPETVYQAADNYARNIGANPGRSGYDQAVASGRILLEARSLLAQLFNATDPGHIVLAFNATDALNMAIKGVLEPGDHVVTTSMEHNSVLRPLNGLAQRGQITFTVVPGDKFGQVAADQVAAAIQENTKLIIATHVSNVVGTVAPLAEIGKIAQEKGALFLVDGAQSAGNTEIDVQSMSIDLLAFTGHKALLGFQGTGGLYIRPGLNIKPWREGGTGSVSEQDTQPEFFPDCLEAGTANTHGWASICAGIEYIQKIGVAEINAKEWEITHYFLEGLAAIPKITVYGPEITVQRGPIVSCNIAGVDAGIAGFELAERYGIMCRTGLHCAPYAHKTIGTYPEGTIRFSLSHFTTRAELDYTLRSLQEFCREQ